MLENTMAIMLPVLWLMVIALHLARPYMLHMIPRFTLRLAADIWWILYVALRDLVIVLTFIFSIMFLFPDVLLGNSLPITGGLAAVCLFAVLVIKLVRDVDEDRRMFILDRQPPGAWSLALHRSVSSGAAGPPATLPAVSGDRWRLR